MIGHEQSPNTPAIRFRRLKPKIAEDSRPMRSKIAAGWTFSKAMRVLIGT